MGATALCVLIGVVVGGCAQQNGIALARQACNHVNQSIALYENLQTRPASANAARERARAAAELLVAAPLAAEAASDSAQWQALMATLSESGRVPESRLVHALTAQCASAVHPDLAPPANPSPPSSPAPPST